MATIRIATRQSALALWQANHVRSLLLKNRPGLDVDIIGMTTAGDRNKTSPLHQMGGKGVFVKELEVALLEHRADIAVHSMKDVPALLPDGLAILGVCERADPRDALVSNQHQSVLTLPSGARVGSSSLRRRLQLQRARPDLDVRELRGNVETRLSRLDAGDFDAVILAVAGLTRLGLADRISESIAVDLCVPAAGQGAIGIEGRLGDTEVEAAVAAINDPFTKLCVECERALTARLDATCNLPIGAHVSPAGERLAIRAFVGDLRGEGHLSADTACAPADGLRTAARLGDDLIARGARDLIQ